MKALKILILILMVSNNTYGCSRGNTEPVEKTSNTTSDPYTRTLEYDDVMWEAIGNDDIDVGIPFSVTFSSLDIEYRMEDIVKMTLEEKVNFLVVFVFLANAYVNKEDIKMLYELLPRKH